MKKRSTHVFFFILLILFSIVFMFIKKYSRSMREEFDSSLYFPNSSSAPSLSVEEVFEKQVGRPLDPIHKSLFSTSSYLMEEEENDSMKSRKENEWERKMNKYMYYFQKGKKECASKKIVLTGLLRNSEKAIGLWQKWLERFVKEWKDYRIVLSENNSTDETRPLLLQWQQKNKKVILLCDDEEKINHKECKLTGIFERQYEGQNLAPDQERIQKMSILRNLYHDYCCKHFSDFDYVLVIDFDLNGDLYFDGIYHSIGLFTEDESLDAVACNGMLWNSDKKDFEYYDSFAHIDKGESYLFSSFLAKQQHDEYVHSTVNDLYRNFESPREVESAFGGACLYRTKPFCEGKYSYSDEFLSCEHGHFHQNMKLSVNPHMVFLIMGNNGTF